MPALKISYEGGSCEYYCSVTCANDHDVCEGDGEWVSEADYPVDEPCFNCYIALNKSFGDQPIKEQVEAY